MGSLRIIQITDFHLTADPAGVLRNVNTNDSLRRVLAYISAKEPECALLLATGDLADDGSPQAYERIATYLRQAPIPICCLPGNHDDVKLMAGALAKLGINTLQTVNLGAWLVIPLDSTVEDQEGGCLASDALSSLEETLTGASEHHCLIALHHQPVITGGSIDATGLANGEALLELLAGYPNAKAAVFGHVHRDFTTRHGTLRLFGGPATCFQFEAGTPRVSIDKRTPGYRWFELDEDGGVRSGVVFLSDL